MKPYYEEKGITIYHADCRETTEPRSAAIRGAAAMMLPDKKSEQIKLY